MSAAAADDDNIIVIIHFNFCVFTCWLSRLISHYKINSSTQT